MIQNQRPTRTAQDIGQAEGAMERQKVRFVSGDTECVAWHYPGTNGTCVVMAGGGGVTKEPGTALPGGGWIEDFSAGAVKAIGAIEVLAAVGLILPDALDIAPVFVPLAAVGVVLLMIGAVITHVRRHEAALSRRSWPTS